MTLHPSDAAAPGHATKLNHSPSFTIPPDRLRRSVPPLHKGGFFAQANTTGKESMRGRYFAYKLRFNRYLPAKTRAGPVSGQAQCLGSRSSLCLGEHNQPSCKTRAAGFPAALECIAPAFLWLSAGMHPGPFQGWPASLGAPRHSSPYSLGEFWPSGHRTVSPGVDPRPTGSPPDEWRATAG